MAKNILVGIVCKMKAIMDFILIGILKARCPFAINILLPNL